MAFRHAFQDALQKIINALHFVPVIDVQHLYLMSAASSRHLNGLILLLLPVYCA